MELSYFDFIKMTDLARYKLFIITGDEPLQRYNIIEKITTEFKDKNFEIVRYDLSEQNHDILYQAADSLSLFNMEKLIQFSFEKAPQKSLQQAMVENILKPGDNVYLLVFNAIKKQNLSSKWFQSLAQNAIHVHIHQPNMTNAISIINHELQQTSITLTAEAVQLLAQKTEGNLIAAKQIIKLLSRQNIQSFDDKVLKPFLHEHTNFDVFDLSDAILNQQKSKALTILNSILNESDKPPLILWALKRELRIISQLKSTQRNHHQKIFDDNNIWSSKQKYYTSLANRIGSEIILSCLQKCLDTDLCIKGAKQGNINLKLNDIVFGLVS
ncbi:DNA polymerase III subunit delta [Allofrancisella guangzhouensis]|uniref:DNA polymerase III subunit delta n=1 Tax=Allofrancisella guangzhouensis TaxID=594679 RepID=A0A0A8E232_9GAMM|nr:DNA polymerase III subunit delta [Allofrancisella guangzhouensis]AJC48270.1 DNA polymerase III subunit delta [Allofrancisella guangzhouensis]MBK2027501.1 DNA polymerase III subunit delta [Allofrancisella guangzhouensis]MBK2044390.1 DNA polymerase III subunit delta [Allofrancisella guangzhouensis]MBK2045424.1 DNA polymerase III subunit delta [Allofrancisella guangzhouensis]